MRKILLGVLVALLLALSVYTAVYGISLGNIKISGIPLIKQKNAELETKIEKANQLKNETYPSSVNKLESEYKNLISEKERYEQIVELGVDANGQPLNKIQEYEVEKIWVTMGNYAKKQGVDLKMDVSQNNEISKSYDLTFTVTGGYIQITDFLYDVERDSTLVFKLENFKMVPGSSNSNNNNNSSNSSSNSNSSSSSSNSNSSSTGTSEKKTDDNDNLEATFVCKDIKLNISGINTVKTDNTNSSNGTSGTGTSDTSTQNNSNDSTTSTNSNSNS